MKQLATLLTTIPQNARLLVVLLVLPLLLLIPLVIATSPSALVLVLVPYGLLYAAAAVVALRQAWDPAAPGDPP